MCLTWSGYISVRTIFGILHGSRTRGNHYSRVCSARTIWQMLIIDFYKYISYVGLRVVPYDNLVFHSTTVLILRIRNCQSVATDGYLDTSTYFYDSLVIMLRRSIKRHLISLSPSRESLAPSSDSFVNPDEDNSICCYLALHSRHFVRHFEICNPICVILIKLISGAITQNLVIKRSICINKWLSYSKL